MYSENSTDEDLRRRGPGAPQNTACQPETLNWRAGWCLQIMRGFFSTTATAKIKTTATAKIKGILWGAIIKATQSPTAALFFISRRTIEQVS